MRGLAWRGAAVGLCAGLALIGLLILLPRARQDSFYEVGDPLIVMGVPLLVMGTAVGAMLGLALGRRRGAHPSTGVVVILGLVACLLAVWLFLWGTGSLG